MPLICFALTLQFYKMVHFLSSIYISQSGFQITSSQQSLSIQEEAVDHHEMDSQQTATGKEMMLLLSSCVVRELTSGPMAVISLDSAG